MSESMVGKNVYRLKGYPIPEFLAQCNNPTSIHEVGAKGTSGPAWWVKHLALL